MRRNTCEQNDKFEVNSETVSQKIYVTTELRSHLPRGGFFRGKPAYFSFFPPYFLNLGVVLVQHFSLLLASCSF